MKQRKFRRRNAAGKREKAAKHLALFLGFMLLFTMISRGIYAYKMPRVLTGQAEQKSIFHTIRADGSVESASETAVVLMEGIRIREICVKTGEKIEPDTVLLCLDETDLKNMIGNLQQKILAAEEKTAAFIRNDQGDKSGLIETQYDLERLRKQQDVCQEYLEKNGRIESGKEGYVTEICVKAGDRTPDSAVILLADCSETGKWIFKAYLTGEQAEFMKAGDAVTLQFQNGGIKEEGCPVTSVRKTEEGEYEVMADVTADGLSPGENGMLELTSQSRKYGCCVPLAAVHADDSSEYVLLVREMDTILGTELTVWRKNVKVADKNESTAVLEENAIGEEEKFVVYADKEMVSGDKVRLLEEEDEGVRL